MFGGSWGAYRLDLMVFWDMGVNRLMMEVESEYSVVEDS